jgi:hypothetical protein
MPRKTSGPVWISERLVAIALTILGAMGGMAFNAYTIAEKIATKPYVDEKTTEVRKYTDEKSAQVLQTAFEHSDMNRQQMLLKMETYGSDVKSQGVKIDLVLDTVRALQQESFKNIRRQ